LQGSIVQISLSAGGVPKLPVGEAYVSRLGVEGDGHAHPRFHGGPEKAVLMIDADAVDDLAARGYPVFYGALGENLTVRGLDRRAWRAGQVYRAGGVILELTTVRVPCATIERYGPEIRQEIYDRQVKAGDPASPRWAMSGFYARVIEPGFVRAEDIIRLMSTPA
jgi:MOSC domain-containing protein YiiM